MGRKKKFNEVSKVLTIRVPESKYNEIKNIISNILEGKGDSEYRIQNKNSNGLIGHLKFLNDFFKENIEYLIENKEIDIFIGENEEIFNNIEVLVK